MGILPTGDGNPVGTQVAYLRLARFLILHLVCHIQKLTRVGKVLQLSGKTTTPDSKLLTFRNHDLGRAMERQGKRTRFPRESHHAPGITRNRQNRANESQRNPRI